MRKRWCQGFDDLSWQFFLSFLQQQRFAMPACARNLSVLATSTAASVLHAVDDHCKDRTLFEVTGQLRCPSCSLAAELTSVVYRQ